MKSPRVAVIVLTWNGKEDTLECLKSLRQVTYPNFWTVVVDNGSTDGTGDAVRASYPEVELIETGENLGFAAGNNVGIEHALRNGADAVLLLNNDTAVDPEFLSLLVQSLYRSDDIAAVSPLIYYYDLPDVIWAAGGKIDRKTGISYQLHIDERDTGQLTEEFDVDYGVGAALLIRREALETIGLLDPRTFLYYEESDWCFRAKEAGLRTVIVPSSKIWHKVSRSISPGSNTQLYYFCRNRLYFLKKHGIGKGRLLHLSLTHFGRMAAAMAVRGDKKASHTVLRAVCDFYRGKMGKARL
ncbi:MAG TPA: glycosyltransferase family 2 protein [Armatimonadota bacterium]|nr:glycosyltransferase family 2 protein [Armatimonadota bacterium]